MSTLPVLPAILSSGSPDDVRHTFIQRLRKRERSHSATPVLRPSGSGRRRIWAAVTSLLLVSEFAFIALGSPYSVAAGDCRWDGTAPACDGSCNEDETEVTRSATQPLGVPPLYYGDHFGDACATGTKAYCCKAAGISCRWDGTAPFCNGSCKSGEKEGQPPPGSSSGRECVSGSKTYCCHSTHTGSGASALTANPKLTRYAAFWEKGEGPAWEARHGLTSAQ